MFINKIQTFLKESYKAKSVPIQHLQPVALDYHLKINLLPIISIKL